MRIYLCGGINGLTDAQCNSWRDYAASHLRHETINPMRRDYRGREDENISAIVEDDKADIEGCDALLVNAVSSSWGTAMEVLYAWERGKPCYCVVTGRVSPWLRYHSRALFESLDAAIEALNA